MDRGPWRRFLRPAAVSGGAAGVSALVGIPLVGTAFMLELGRRRGISFGVERVIAALPVTAAMMVLGLGGPYLATLTCLATVAVATMAGTAKGRDELYSVAPSADNTTSVSLILNWLASLDGPRP